MGHESLPQADGPDSVNQRPLRQAKAVVTRVREMLAPLPVGYSVELDSSTHNILVSNELLGFAISKKAIEDGIWVSGVRPAFECLVRETNKLRGATVTESGGKEQPNSRDPDG